MKQQRNNQNLRKKYQEGEKRGGKKNFHLGCQGWVSAQIGHLGPHPGREQRLAPRPSKAATYPASYNNCSWLVPECVRCLERRRLISFKMPLQHFGIFQVSNCYFSSNAKQIKTHSYGRSKCILENIYKFGPVQFEGSSYLFQKRTRCLNPRYVQVTINNFAITERFSKFLKNNMMLLH